MADRLAVAADGAHVGRCDAGVLQQGQGGVTKLCTQRAVEWAQTLDLVVAREGDRRDVCAQ